MDWSERLMSDIQKINDNNPADEMNVLLVDDEKHFREILAKRLGQRGITALQASDGEEALRLLEEKPVEVIVMDVKMPKMNGIEALRHVKENYPASEVIMLTGHASTQDGVDGIKSGAFDYLTKPIEFEQLLRKIRQAQNKIKRAQAEKKEAEFRERVKQQMAINERLVALGTIAAGVAHEINNPLAIIQEAAGWVRQILVKPEMNEMPRKPDFEKALDRIQSSVDRARRISHQLLQVVKTQSAGIPDLLEMTQVNLKKLVEECILLVELEAAYKKIEISLECSEPDPVISTDPYQLAQVFLNLLTNAIQATDSSGKINISIKPSSDQIHLAVSDNGCGIPKENLNKIFEPFFSTKAVGVGTGMGLYISSGIVSKLGGMLTVESQVGEGTTFTIQLPFNK
jgi:two-component system, NtrC family, sensor kinase